jgi:Ca2+/Na+ antiporter
MEELLGVIIGATIFFIIGKKKKNKNLQYGAISAGLTLAITKLFGVIGLIFATLILALVYVTIQREKEEKEEKDLSTKEEKEEINDFPNTKVSYFSYIAFGVSSVVNGIVLFVSSIINYIKDAVKKFFNYFYSGF